MDVDESQPGAMAAFLGALLSYLPPAGRMLIVGCGTGEEISDAQSLGWKVDGITLAPMNVAWAAEHGIAEVFEDFHFSSFQTGIFDAIVGRQVWEHSWAPFIFAIECARLLRPGGKLILETPNCKDFIYNSSTVHHVFCPTPYQGARMLEKAGFVNVTALDGTDGAMRPFPDEHRDDVGGPHVIFTGTRWGKSDSDKVNPMVREMTSTRLP